MENGRLAVVLAVSVLLVAGAGPVLAQNGNGLSDLLSDPTLRPFINTVLGLPKCMNDPAIFQLKFDLTQCPSLLRLLDAVQLQNPNPPVTCDMSCVGEFNKLTDACARDLRDAFSADTTSNVGAVATAWFEACDELVAGSQPGASPSIAPSPAPAPMPEAAAPSPEPVEVPASVPAPAPAPSSGAVAMLPSAVLGVLAAAAVLLL